MLKNVAVSVRERLKNRAKADQREYNAVLLQYFQERFLYRLSMSPYKSNFILKGAFLFLAFDMPRSRPTMDVDFLGMNTSNEPENIRKIIQDVLSIDAEDGVVFISESIKVERITEAKNYHGLRLRFMATMDTIQRMTQIDLGFGDQPLPQPKIIEFPTLLDMPAPFVLAYHPVNVIAEKFEAIISLQILNSRLKDFFDIYFLATRIKFNSDELITAIQTTFKNRGTDIENRIHIFSNVF